MKEKREESDESRMIEVIRIEYNKSKYDGKQTIDLDIMLSVRKN